MKLNPIQEREREREREGEREREQKIRITERGQTGVKISRKFEYLLFWNAVVNGASASQAPGIDFIWLVYSY